MSARAETREGTGGGLSLQTLVIASLASVAAAIFIHEIWTGGAIIGAAITPIIVAIVSEALKRPAERLTVVRRAPVFDAAEDERPADRGERWRRPEPRFSRPDPDAEPETTREDRFGIWQADEPSWRERLGGRRLKLALATGALAFVVGVVALTGTELVFGGSVGSSDSRTTVLGGGSSSSSAEEEQDAPATSTTEEEPVQTEPVPSDPEAPSTTTPVPAAPEPGTTTPAPGAEPVPAQPAPAQPATPAPEGGAAAPAEPVP